MWYSSHRSEIGTLSARWRLTIVAFSSAKKWRLGFAFPLDWLMDSSVLHTVERSGVTFQLNRNKSSETENYQGSKQSPKNAPSPGRPVHAFVGQLLRTGFIIDTRAAFY